MRSKTITIGEMRDRVTIQSASRGVTVGGEKTLSWSDVDTVWACVEDLSGSESVNERQTTAEVVSRVTIRWRPDVRAKSRFTFEGSILDVESAINLDGVKRFLTCTCRRKEA